MADSDETCICLVATGGACWGGLQRWCVAHATDQLLAQVLFLIVRSAYAYTPYIGRTEVWKAVGLITTPQASGTGVNKGREIWGRPSRSTGPSCGLGTCLIKRGALGARDLLDNPPVPCRVFVCNPSGREARWKSVLGVGHEICPNCIHQEGDMPRPACPRLSRAEPCSAGLWTTLDAPTKFMLRRRCTPPDQRIIACNRH